MRESRSNPARMRSVTTAENLFQLIVGQFQRACGVSRQGGQLFFIEVLAILFVFPGAYNIEFHAKVSFLYSAMNVLLPVRSESSATKHIDPSIMGWLLSPTHH